MRAGLHGLGIGDESSQMADRAPVSRHCIQDRRLLLRKPSAEWQLTQFNSPSNKRAADGRIRILTRSESARSPARSDARRSERRRRRQFPELRRSNEWVRPCRFSKALADATAWVEWRDEKVISGMSTKKASQLAAWMQAIYLGRREPAIPALIQRFVQLVERAAGTPCAYSPRLPPTASRAKSGSPWWPSGRPIPLGRNNCWRRGAGIAPHDSATRFR